MRVAALVLAVLACLVPAGAALADDDSGSGRVIVATATVQEDGEAEFDFAWAIDRPSGGVVDHVKRGPR